MEGNRNSTSDILRSFKALKENIMSTLNVCSICKVQAVSGDYTTCELVNKPKTMIQCFHGGTLTNADVGKYVIVIFTDDDTRTNILRIKDGEEPVAVPRENVKHSLNFGIVIAKINIGE